MKSFPNLTQNLYKIGFVDYLVKGESMDVDNSIAVENSMLTFQLDMP